MDAARGAWLAVALEDGRFAGATLAPAIEAVLAMHSESHAVAIDIPLGIIETYGRDAEASARTGSRELRGGACRAPPLSRLSGCVHYVHDPPEHELARARGFGATVMSVDILARIRDDRPPRGATLWWLGQSGFIIKSAGSTIVVDAFLTDYGSVGRRYPPPFAPHDITDADLLVGTHDHLDHIDPEGLPAMALASPQADVVVPHPVVERVVELGIPRHRVRGAEVDVPLESDGVRILPIPAFHGATPERGYGFHRDEIGRHPFLGYTFALEGIRICHVGDTLVYEGLGERLRSLELDLLILPINGRSWYRERRGIVGNVNVFEAAELAAESGVSCVVPVHWDLFDDNMEDPAHFESYVHAHHPSVNVEIPVIGAAIPVGAEGRSGV